MLVNMRITVQRRLHVRRIERHVGREAVEAAAAHEVDQVHQHVAGRLDLAGVAHLAQDARAREAAAVAELRKVDLNQPHPLEMRAEAAHVVAGLDAYGVRVRLVQEGIEADRRLVGHRIVAEAQSLNHKSLP